MFLLHSKLKMGKYAKEGSNIVSIFHDTVRRNPDKLAFVLVDGHQMTFRFVPYVFSYLNLIDMLWCYRLIVTSQ